MGQLVDLARNVSCRTVAPPFRYEAANSERNRKPLLGSSECYSVDVVIIIIVHGPPRHVL